MEEDQQWTASPSQGDSDQWYVWPVHEDLPPRVVFVGPLEECGLVADALNGGAITGR